MDEAPKMLGLGRVAMQLGIADEEELTEAIRYWATARPHLATIDRAQAQIATALRGIYR